jgi:tripartite-type tricarboxylate transporter receptor subunit TctC
MISAPPEVPKDRIEAMRAALLKAMVDPELLADARKARLEIIPMAGQEVQALVAELYATPSAVVQTAAEMLK